jgi:transposase InsO family protein
MNKEGIRKEFFKLKFKGHSYSQCRKLILAQFGYEVTARTLQRWERKLRTNKWDLKDESKKPKTSYTKITSNIETKVINIRKQTGFGERKIKEYFDGLSHKIINKILRKYNLTNPNDNRRKRIKYIRWQREHPNSLWQMDVSDQKVEGKYCFAIIDDCSRYCLGLFEVNNISTKIITKLLDDVIKVHGKPREILSDNGNVFGLRSKHSQFDRWCNRRKIKHIRTAIHSPTTTGKIERFFQTLANELPFCNKSLNRFRMRYNHFRPHSSLHGKVPADIYFAFYKLF